MSTTRRNPISKFFLGPMKGSENPKQLDNHVAVVTGGNRGIGKEVAIDLASRGCNVFILCRDLDRGRETAKEINLSVNKFIEKSKIFLEFNLNLQTRRNGVVPLKCDLSSMASVRKCCESLLKRKITINFLVCNAGK